MNHRSTSVKPYAVALALVALVNTQAHASNNTPGGFSSEMRLGQAFSYDSNPLRLSNGEDAIYGSTTSPELVLRQKTPLSLVESNTRIDANFFDQSEFDSVDAHQKFNLERSNQRWTAGLRALLDYDTTRTSELTNYSLNLPRVHSTRLSAIPKITFRPSVRESISLTTSVSNVTYNNRAFTDYNLYSIRPSYTYKFDEQNSGVFSVVGQRYETSNGTSLRSDSIGPSFGWIALLTPQLTLKLDGGVQSTEKSGAGASTDRSSWNYVFSGDIAYTDQTDTLDFRYTRAREPFGNGTETLLDSFILTEKHKLTPLLELQADAKYQSADYPAAQTGTNLDYGYSLGAGMSYKVLEDVSLSANYRFRYEELKNVTGSVDAHVAMVSISIQPSWSRN